MSKEAYIYMACIYIDHGMHNMSKEGYTYEKESYTQFQKRPIFMDPPPFRVMHNIAQETSIYV